MTDPDRRARKGEGFQYRDEHGQEWLASWHPPELPAPDGTPHGSAGICFTSENNVVLVTWPGVEWELPGGRPDGDEDWRQTLDREVLEEACAVVDDATLLGYVRVACVEGPEEGRVSVRSLWCADVSLKPWEPRHETTARIIVPPGEAPERVGFGGGRRQTVGVATAALEAAAPIYERWFRDALAVKGLA